MSYRRENKAALFDGNNGKLQCSSYYKQGPAYQDGGMAVLEPSMSNRLKDFDLCTNVVRVPLFNLLDKLDQLCDSEHENRQQTNIFSSATFRGSMK